MRSFSLVSCHFSIVNVSDIAVFSNGAILMYCKDFVKGVGDIQFFFRNRDSHVRRNSNPYLSPYCVFVLPPEGFYFQVLFDPFKKYFHVPPAFIEFCNCLTTYFIVVCQENKSSV